MNKILLLLLLTQLTFASNLTEKYLKARESIANTDVSEIVKKVNGATVIMLPGILSETTIDGSDQPINVSSVLGDYFKDYIDWLSQAGIKNKRVIVESEDTVDNNAKYIAKELLKIKGKLIIISHSKGGLEFLNVLIDNPEIKERTKLWVAMQSPFLGADLADTLASTPILKHGTGWIFDFLGGSLEGMASVGTKSRSAFHKSHKEEISKVLKEVNFVQYATYIENSFGPETPLEVTRDLISLSKGRNDGLVEVSSAYVPYGRFIVESGVDHLTTVVDFRRLNLVPALTRKYKNWNFNRVNHLKALLKVAL